MKNLIILAIGATAVCVLNIGCSASAGIHPSGSIAKPSSTVQVAYVGTPQAK